MKDVTANTSRTAILGTPVVTLQGCSSLNDNYYTEFPIGFDLSGKHEKDKELLMIASRIERIQNKTPKTISKMNEK